MDTLLQPHYRATEARLRPETMVLAVQDTTSLNYSAHAATAGLGPQCWARDPADCGKKTLRHRLPIEEKESVKWLKSLRAVAAVQARCPSTTLVSVGDREADIYELFAEALAKPDRPKPGLFV